MSEYSLGSAPIAVYADNDALERAYYGRRNAPPGMSTDTLAHMTSTPDIASPRDGMMYDLHVQPFSTCTLLPHSLFAKILTSLPLSSLA